MIYETSLAFKFLHTSHHLHSLNLATTVLPNRKPLQLLPFWTLRMTREQFVEEIKAQLTDTRTWFPNQHHENKIGLDYNKLGLASKVEAQSQFNSLTQTAADIKWSFTNSIHGILDKKLLHTPQTHKTHPPITLPSPNID